VIVFVRVIVFVVRVIVAVRVRVHAPTPWAPEKVVRTFDEGDWSGPHARRAAHAHGAITRTNTNTNRSGAGIRTGQR
jgi:hypothetical protein